MRRKGQADHRLWWVALGLITAGLATLAVPQELAGPLLWVVNERHEVRGLQVAAALLLVGGSLLLLYLMHLHMEGRLRRRRGGE